MPPDRWQAKPHSGRAFWISDESAERGWLDWCLSERFRWNCLRYYHHLTLRPDHNVLIVNEEVDFVRVNHQYRVVEDGLNGVQFMYGFRWDQFAKDYDGLIITPYMWMFRHESKHFWYNGWDCASGLILRPKAAIQFIGPPLRTPMRCGNDEDEDKHSPEIAILPVKGPDQQHSVCMMQSDGPHTMWTGPLSGCEQMVWFYLYGAGLDSHQADYQADELARVSDTMWQYLYHPQNGVATPRRLEMDERNSRQI